MWKQEKGVSFNLWAYKRERGEEAAWPAAAVELRNRERRGREDQRRLKMHSLHNFLV